MARHGPHLAAQHSDSLGIWLAVAICIGGVLPLSAFIRSRRVAPATAPPQKSTAPTPHDADDDESQLDQDLQLD